MRFSFGFFFRLLLFAEQTIAEAVADWYVGENHGVEEIDCAFPCINPTCSSQLDL
jgi:O-palmitoleoyl-L-serine hydrolase